MIMANFLKSRKSVRELMKEKKLKIIEEKLLEVVEDSRLMGFTYEEINDMLKILFEEVI